MLQRSYDGQTVQGSANKDIANSIKFLEGFKKESAQALDGSTGLF